MTAHGHTGRRLARAGAASAPASAFADAPAPTSPVVGRWRWQGDVYDATRRWHSERAAASLLRHPPHAGSERARGARGVRMLRPGGASAAQGRCVGESGQDRLGKARMWSCIGPACSAAQPEFLVLYKQLLCRITSGSYPHDFPASCNTFSPPYLITQVVARCCLRCGAA